MVARYSFTPEITVGDAAKAIADCNAIADMLQRNGFSSIRIKSKAHRLAVEQHPRRFESPNLADLMDTLNEKTSDSFKGIAKTHSNRDVR